MATMDAPPSSSAPPPADVVPPHHSSSAAPSQHASPDLKRKRSPSDGTHATPTHSGQPPAKKTTNHLQINYLARQFEDDLPLVSTDDTMPAILHLLGEYQGVLDRHESMAGNLGARPLGPILIKRFERLFDGPPKVIKAHGKEGGTGGVTWLDVVEFARNKPEQFTLGQMSEGVRVCQFYTKQCRVQISEEDWVLINSGIPQKMIPPQPIMEDEEKELGTLEILEKSLASICHLADQVAARTRQLNHKLKGRKQAILDRRATSPSVSIRSSSPSALAYLNGTPNGSAALSTTGPSGFTAVNATPRPTSSSANGEKSHHTPGTSSANTRAELLSKFHTLADRRASSGGANGDLRFGSPRTSSGAGSGTLHSPGGYGSSNFTSAPPHSQGQGSSGAPVAPYGASPNFNNVARAPDAVAAAAAAANALNRPPRQRQPQPQDDDAQPFRAAMVAKMEALAKGDRVIPPCDRCRRLHMDCIKNLTACLGCTRKHAKCSWWEVKAGEVEGDGEDASAGEGTELTLNGAGRDVTENGDASTDGSAVDRLAEAAYAARVAHTDDRGAAHAGDGAAALSALGQLGMSTLERFAAEGGLEIPAAAHSETTKMTTDGAVAHANVGVDHEMGGTATTGADRYGHISADEPRGDVNGLHEEHDRRGFGEVEMREGRDVEMEKVDA